MKRIIGIILLVLFLVGFWIGLSALLYNGGMSLVISVIIPLGCYTLIVLLSNFVNLIKWLLTSENNSKEHSK